MDLLSQFFNSHFRYRSPPRSKQGAIDDALVSLEDDMIVVRPAASSQVHDTIPFQDVVAVNYGDSSLQVTILQMRRKSCTSSAGRQRRDIVLERLDRWDEDLDVVATALLHLSLGDLDVILDGTSKCPTKTRALIIINPASGKGNAMNLYTNIAKPLFDLCQDRFMIEEVVSESTEHTKKVAVEAADKFDAFIFCGGDGLTHDFLQGIFKLPDYRDILSRVTLGFLPAGSGNGLACSCAYSSEPDLAGDPKGFVSDFYVALRLILRGNTCSLDAATMEILDRETGERKDTLLACLNAGWGLFSDVDIGSEHLRFLGGARFTTYALWRIINLRQYAARLSYIEASDLTDGKQLNSLPDRSCPLWHTEEGVFAGVVLSNVSHSGADMMVAPERTLGDGCWSMCYLPYKDASFGNLVSGLASMEMGRHTEMSHFWKARSVVAWRIEPANEQSETTGEGAAVDGESVQRGELCGSVIPRVVNVYASRREAEPSSGP
ncbi:Sphingosine kinase 2 [Perkinsus olseni]|uniref:Sphingosine kinase 2 n=1 Tax=Perkinsus olseni TaxID=32597 RepID=A0A7J6LKR4_PEROL|nr:Sphingosine kinase 2 [Perkinsus olseni]